MVMLQADVTCDGWLYKTPAGERIERCKTSFLSWISFDNPRTSLRKVVREHTWWHDLKSSSSYPKHVCPSCRALMLGKMFSDVSTAKSE